MPGLTRIASDTGGRVTAGSNDMSLGYAHARRDLGCRYTIGFYDRKPEENRRHTIRVDVKRDGLRVAHPSSYEFPSKEARRESALQAAYLAPGLFGGDVHAHIFPLGPAGSGQWDAMITVDFPLVRDDERVQEARVDFGVVLRRGTTVIHSFDRRISLAAKDPSGALSRRSVTFNEPIRIRPGAYTVTTVASRPDTEDKPMSAEIQVQVPPIPKAETFLVGPILGRRAAENLVVNATGTKGKAADAPSDRVGSAESFRPLLVQEVAKGDPLVALSEACVGKGGASQGERLRRWLTTGDGAPAGALASVELHLSEKEAVQCQPFLDVLPVASMRPGPYRFQMALEPDSQEQDPAEVRFRVLPSDAR